MFVNYDPEVDIIDFSVRGRAVACSLYYDHDVVVNLGSEDGKDIIGVMLMCASSYLPLGKRGYDGKTDTLMMGRTTDTPELISECGDFVGYWQPDPEEERAGAYHYVIGVALKRASVHLAEVSAQIAGVPAIGVGGG